MRIIAGELKGRRIAAPEGEGTRPLLARVRKALFSTLGDLVPEARVLDLYAGCGSIGLEAWSRGAQSVVCVEREREALRYLRTNVETFGVAEHVQVRRGNALQARSWQSATGEAEDWAELVFLDPPYPSLQRRDEREQLFRAVAALHERVLRQGGALVLHTHLRAADRIDFPRGLELERRAYGNTALWYLWKGAARPLATQAEGDEEPAEEET